MKLLKRIAIGLAAFVAIVLLTALFVGKEMHAEREVVINQPNAAVFSYVKYLKNQTAYSKWGQMDPAMQQQFRGTDGTVGFVSAWESKVDDVGKGEQEIKAIKEGERIDYELRFREPMDSKATAYMITEPVGASQTKVRWGFNGKMAYPFNIVRLFIDIDKAIGADFAAGLSNLKTKLEN